MSRPRIAFIHEGATENLRIPPSRSETPDTAPGRVETVIVERRRGDRSRITTCWFVPGQHHLPVKAEQVTWQS